MNPLKAWNAKLEVGIFFWPSENLNKQCAGTRSEKKKKIHRPQSSIFEKFKMKTLIKLKLTFSEV